jgi:hypothetical protein
MSPFIQEERMAWAWRDPQYGLLHVVNKRVSAAQFIHQVWYRTSCAISLDVDDINDRTMVRAEPTCLGCIVAVPLSDVVQEKR